VGYSFTLLPTEKPEEPLFIGAGIAVLAIAERSVSLGAFAVSFLALALLANLYDISNVIGFGSSPQAEELPNVVLPGLVLLLGAIAFGLSDPRTTFASTGLIRRSRYPRSWVAPITGLPVRGSNRKRPGGAFPTWDLRLRHVAVPKVASEACRETIRP
jgi:hypothetical protein